MRQSALALAILASAAVAAPAQAHDMHVHASCSVETDYDIDVQHNAILFSRTDGSPHTVRMHDGTLQVDGRALAVSQADAARLRQYEAQVRALLPEAAGIAREGVGIGFDALTTVAATFAEQPDERSEVIRKLTAQRQRVLAQIDQGIGRGQWRQHGMDQLLDEGMGDAVSTLVSTVAARAVKAALSGDQTQVAALEARADSLDKSIDRAIEAPARRLGERADALCPRLLALDQLQRQFSLRLPDGSALSLMTVGQDHGRHEAVAGTSDH
ncbi:MAG: DUF2884 family protein [Rhodanobacter sp.]|jgi:hypothetical protein